ncbi:GNAT superfamily N-acetyltransferase [Paenibacillus sp. V4I9]|uniref:GNAT family N-acetyltransferase n=1 Tax=Paenibacillus sp. V4I9 TaxID=3042308 RepID=UPI002789E33F|nr:GNAT family N-acetyltransferase [Paenibacillus sp. V4I9]MDQ0887862.1 GNAT superfamily N-acetyltransferase [Paenibacillus sp. V4I9]
MIYRPSNEDEIPTIAELKLKMFEEVGMSHLLISNFIEEVISIYSTLYINGKAQHFVIEENKHVVACAGAFIKEDIPYSFYNERKYGFVGDVYVEPKFRKLGYAKLLTNAVLNWFTEQDIRTVRLLASHNARHLYESIGFKATDEMVLRIE